MLFLANRKKKSFLLDFKYKIILFADNKKLIRCIGL